MSKKTHNNPLSKHEVEVLRRSPYVKSVTVNSVCFTEEFKRILYNEKQGGTPIPDAMRAGNTPVACFSQTLRKYDIDPEILGQSRIDGLSYTLNKRAKREDGFSDGRDQNKRCPPSEDGDSVERQLQRLRAELAYTRQEVEFLKKLQAANTEAQKQWESRHRQK